MLARFGLAAGGRREESGQRGEDSAGRVEQSVVWGLTVRSWIGSSASDCGGGLAAWRG